MSSETPKRRWILSGQTAELLGISWQAVSKWESGQGKPDLDNLIRLTEIYNVSADYILSGIEKEPETPVSKKEDLSPEVRKMLCSLAVIAGTALVTVLFITALGFVAKYLL